ncbi:MAG: hypothetical protein AB1633_10105 [Elusimicrobiota bacterium]
MDIKNAWLDSQSIKNGFFANLVIKGRHSSMFSTIVSFNKQLPSLEKIDSIFNSPAKNKIIKGLQKNDLVLVVLKGPDSEENKKFIQCAKNGRKMAKDMAEKKCLIIEVAIDDPREHYFLNNIFMENQTRRAGIFIMFGKGKGLYFINNPSLEKTIFSIAEMLDRQANIKASELGPRIILNMPVPKFR